MNANEHEYNRIFPATNVGATGNTVFSYLRLFASIRGSNFGQLVVLRALRDSVVIFHAEAETNL
jgi:hypothetical protein